MRAILVSATFTNLAIASPHEAAIAPEGVVPREMVSPFGHVDSDHPAIVARAAAIAGSLADQRQAAVAIHDWVRDEVPFGFARAFHDQRASEVLAEGKGFCNTKATLFTALLRARGIPARIRYVDIRTDVLDGVIDPRTVYVDHSFTEVFLEGRWVRTDSYIVDRTLADRARARLAKEGRLFGYGVARDGTSDWDGRTDAFSQYVVGSGSLEKPTSTRDWGVHPDVRSFYAAVLDARNRGFGPRIAIWLLAGGANARIAALRQVAND